MPVFGIIALNDTVTNELENFAIKSFSTLDIISPIAWRN
jgi:hypothetical protein